MSRYIALFGLLLTLAVIGVGGWIAARPPVGLFLAPGATDVQVRRHGWNEWQISYYAPDSPTPWYADVADQLEARGWNSQDRGGYGALSRSYSRAVSFGACELWEWAFLTIDPLRPRTAQIRVRRWIAIR